MKTFCPLWQGHLKKLSSSYKGFKALSFKLIGYTLPSIESRGSDVDVDT